MVCCNGALLPLCRLEVVVKRCDCVDERAVKLGQLEEGWRGDCTAGWAAMAARVCWNGLECYAQRLTSKLCDEAVYGLMRVDSQILVPSASSRVAVQLSPALLRSEPRAGEPLIARVD